MSLLCTCGGESVVVDSRQVGGQNVTRRRRRCLACRESFNSFEVVEGTPITWLVVATDQEDAIVEEVHVEEIPMKKDGERETVSVMQACARASVCRKTIYNWLAAGKIESIRTAGGGVRIYTDTLFRMPQKTVASNG